MNFIKNLAKYCIGCMALFAGLKQASNFIEGFVTALEEDNNEID